MCWQVTFGQVLVQFMIVWQRYSENGSCSLDRRSSVKSSRESIIQRYAWGVKGCSTRQLLRWCSSTTARLGAYLHQDSGAKVLIAVPPVTGAAGAAAGTQNTLVQAVLQQTRSLAAHDHNNRILLRWRRNCTSFCLSCTDCRYCSFPSLASSFFFR